MVLVNIEKINRKDEIDPMQYICPKCGQTFIGSEAVEKMMLSKKKKFWFRYAGQLVNHLTKHHMSEHVDTLFKAFKDKEENKSKKFEISFSQHSKMNDMSKKIILEEVPKKFPKTVAISLIKAMLELEDNGKKMKKTIQKKLSEMEAE